MEEYKCRYHISQISSAKSVNLIREKKQFLKFSSGVSVNNLSLNETQKVFDFISNVKKSGRSVLFIGHNIYHVYDISDRFVILDRGEVIHMLSKEKVRTADDLMKIMRETIKGH